MAADACQVDSALQRPVPELYIYYRVAAPQEPQARAAVMAMQSALREAHPGLQSRLLRRPEASEGLLTFMEVYLIPVPPDADDDSATPARIEAAIEAAAAACLSPWLQGGRHVEVFVPCA